MHNTLAHSCTAINHVLRRARLKKCLHAYNQCVVATEERSQTLKSVRSMSWACKRSFGTMEELMEMVTWQQLGYHKKPVGLLNISGFYDALLQFFDRCVEDVRPEPCLPPTLLLQSLGTLRLTCGRVVGLARQCIICCITGARRVRMG